MRVFARGRLVGAFSSNCEGCWFGREVVGSHWVGRNLGMLSRA